MTCNYAYNSIGSKMKAVLQSERNKERIKKRSHQIVITNEQSIHCAVEYVRSE